MKKFKRIFCMLFACFLISQSTTAAYATGFEGVVAASALGGPEVVIACLAVVGVIVVYDKREEIGSTLDYAVRQTAKEVGIASSQVSAFYRKAQSGVIDTSSKVWSIMKSKCQEWTHENINKISSTSSVGTDINDVKAGTVLTTFSNGNPDLRIGSMAAAAPVGCFTYYSTTSQEKGLIIYSSKPFTYTWSNSGLSNLQTARCLYDGEVKVYGQSINSWSYGFGYAYTFATKYDAIYKAKDLLPSLGVPPITLMSLGIQKVIDINSKTTVADISITGDTDIDVNAIAAGVGVGSWDEVMEKVGSGEIAIDDALAVEGITYMPIDAGAIPTTAEIASTVTSADRAEVPAVSTDSKANDFSLPIVDLFPFCIPFDLYDFVAAFDAPPMAPSVKLSVNIPVINVPFEYKIDMTVLDPLAATVRNLELIAFLLGLMVVTHKLIKW